MKKRINTQPTYNDSLNLYNAYQFQKKNINPKPLIDEYVSAINEYAKKNPRISPTTPAKLAAARKKNFTESSRNGNLSSYNYKSMVKNPRQGNDPMMKSTGDKKIYDYYKSLKFDDKVAIGEYSSPDIVHSRIRPTGEYYDGIALSPVYKKPIGNKKVQPIVNVPEVKKKVNSDGSTTSTVIKSKPVITNIQPVQKKYEYPVDSIMYTSPRPDRSEKRSNTIDFINSNKPRLQELRNEGYLNEDAVNQLMKEKGAIKIGESKKYPRKSYSTTPKYVAGTPATMDYMNVGSSIAQGAGGLLINEDKSSVGNYAGNILSNAGSFASMGAALGPWGMAGGAVLGAGIGVVQSINEEKAQNARETQEEINARVTQNNMVSNSVKAESDLKNMTNRRVPGLKKGAAKFKSSTVNPNDPNAMIANEEVVMDGNTGELNTVPGKYDKNNPDKVLANLTEDSSVFSKQDRQQLPYGTKTPADIMKKAEKIQKRSNYILDNKNKYSRLDRMTAELNNKNIQDQAEKFNQFNILMNPTPQIGGLPKYAAGTDKTTDVQDDPNAPIIGADGKKYYVTPKEESIGKKYGYYTVDKHGGKTYVKSTGVPADSATGQFKKDKFENTGWKISQEEYNKQQNNQVAPTQAPVRVSTDSVSTTAAPVVKVDIKGNTNSNQNRPNYAPPVQTEKVVADPNTGKAFANNPGAIVKPSEAVSNGIGTNYQPQINSSVISSKTSDGGILNARNINSTPKSNWTAPQYTVPQSIYGDTNWKDTSPSNNNAPATQLPVDNKNKFNINQLSSAGNTLMSLAPMVYNARNNEPEIAAPIYDNIINPIERYNIAPQLAESVKQRNIARYNNASINSSTGVNMAYGADTYGRGTESLSKLMQTAEEANAGYRGEYANRYNQVSASNRGEDRRIYDINARNRAASRAFGAKNAEMLSQLGQTRQLMSNQKASDLLNANIWGAYASAMTPEAKKMIEDLITSYQRGV